MMVMMYVCMYVYRSGSGGLGLFEDAVDVREKIARLEKENKALKKEIESE